MWVQVEILGKLRFIIELGARERNGDLTDLFGCRTTSAAPVDPTLEGELPASC